MHAAVAATRDIVVPGSTSNLGPGFDALSIALDVYLRLHSIEVLPDAPGTLEMEFEGGAPVGENRIATGFIQGQAHFKEPAPGIRLRVKSDIPVRAGLGSSAAATIAGLRLYEQVTQSRDAGLLLRLATTIEGHPDNAAAALFGGITVSCQCDDGRVLASAWPCPIDLRFVIATPDAQLETAFARKVLPQEMALRDAVFNLQRALLFVRALDTGQYDWLREAMRDRWHQPARQQFVPGLAEALALDHPSVLGACLSGAGPSVAVVATKDGSAAAAAALTDIYSRLHLPCTVRILSAHAPIAPQDPRS
jgi:homoserine kinase